MTPDEAVELVTDETARDVLRRELRRLWNGLQDQNTMKLRAMEEKHQQEERANAAEEKLKASGEHCATCICGRRAPVQASPAYEGKPPHAAGTISWEEHLLAWADYARRYGRGQSAERMAQRGGFSYWEVADHLGHDPTTWKPR